VSISDDGPDSVDCSNRLEEFQVLSNPCQKLRAVRAPANSDRHLRGVNLTYSVTENDRPQQKIITADAINISVKTGSKPFSGQM
jgi:hypothetical protein